MISRRDADKVNRRKVLNNVQKMRDRRGGNQEPVAATRRPILKGFSVILSSILGLGGTVAGRSPTENKFHEQVSKATADYRSPDAIVEALDGHAAELLDELVNRDYLVPAKGSSLNISQVWVHKSPAEVDPEPGTYLTAFEKDGQFTAHISVVRRTPSRVVRINVQPQAGKSFATIKTRDGELVSVVDPVDDDVSTQKICGSDGYTCPPGSCCTLCGTLQVLHEKTCCQYSDGSVDCYTEPTDDCCDPLTCC